jgi:tripeptide aminopeptidase
VINQERLVALFLELVRIDSPSREEARIARVVERKLSALGAQTRIDELSNVAAILPGRGVGAGKDPLFLNAHSDNVPPANSIRPRVQDGIIRSDGMTVLGADDLAGVAAILEAVHSRREEAAACLPLEIAITTQEEAGMYGAKGLSLSTFSARQGYVIDGPGPVGVITLAAPSVNLIDARIIGKGAHAGHAPEAGINALLAATAAIGKMQIGRVDARTTTNIGTLHSGSARNAVPASAELVAEVRSHSDCQLERETRNMVKQLEQSCKTYGAECQINVRRAYNHFEIGKSDPLVKRVVQALDELGRKPQFESSMGGYDANVWNERGIKCVALSVGDEQNHTTGEFIPVAELVKTAELVERLIAL